MGLAVLFVGGVVSLVLGVIIWAQFPLSGAWTVGILLGIKLFIDKHALTATHFAYFWMDNT